MQAWMWRLTDDHAVIYTDDRETLKALFAYSRFPHQDLSRATTYQRKNGRIFAWQFTFPVSAWNGVVRHLGRASITMLDSERWVPSAELSPAPEVQEKPGSGKKSPAKAPAASKEGAPLKRTRKPESRPVVDLNQPLQPMNAPVANAQPGKPTGKPTGKPMSPKVELHSQPVEAGTKRPRTEKRPASGTTIAEEPASGAGRRGTTKKPVDAAASASRASTPLETVTPRDPKPALATSKAEPTVQPKVGGRAKAAAASKASVPPAVEVAPMSSAAAMQPAAGKEGASLGLPSRAPRKVPDVGKRRSEEEERLRAELAEVQLRLAALTETALPGSARRADRPKAATAAKPVRAGGVGEAPAALPVGMGSKRPRAVMAPEPVRSGTSSRGGATVVAAVPEPPVTPATRKVGPKSRQKRE